MSDPFKWSACIQLGEGLSYSKITHVGNRHFMDMCGIIIHPLLLHQIESILINEGCFTHGLKFPMILPTQLRIWTFNPALGVKTRPVSSKEL